MRNVWIIARHEYLTALLRPSFIIITLLIPLLGLVSLGIAAFAGGQAASFLSEQFDPDINTIAIVDSSGLFSPLLPRYEEEFHPYSDEAAARTALADGQADVLLIFPANYMETGHITVVSAKDNLVVSFLDNSNLVNGFVTDHLLRNT